MPTKIQWTDETDNPIYLLREDGGNGGHWCRKKSPGCSGCYAEAINQSDFFAFASHLPYTGQPPKNLHFDESIVTRWARARRPRKRFVCSMTDLFGDWVPQEWQHKTLDAAAAAPHQTIQLLTKRPDIMLASVQAYRAAGHPIPPNVWFGITVENQDCAGERLGSAIALAEQGCLVWVSYEPALEYVDFTPWFPSCRWIVLGGMSGSIAQPCCVDWFDQVIRARAEWMARWGTQFPVALFVKQWGAHPYTLLPDQYPDHQLIKRDSGVWRIKLRDRHGGNISEFPERLRVQEFPKEVNHVRQTLLAQ